MIWGIGIDLVEVKRIKDAVRRHGGRFLSFAFTGSEIDSNQVKNDNDMYFSTVLAVKEAVVKAFGVGWPGGIAWKEIVVEHRKTGEIEIILSGRASRIMQEKKGKKLHVATAHTAEYVVAQVVLEG